MRIRFLAAFAVVFLSCAGFRWNSVSAATGDEAFRFDLQPSGFDLAAGERRIAYSEGDPLVVLLYSDSPDAWHARSWRMVGPDVPVVHRDGKRLELAIPSFGGLAVKGEISCEVDEVHGELQWTTKLRNEATGTVVCIIGPCLRNVQDGSDGFLAIPNRPGHRIRDPWKTLAPSVQHLEYHVPASMQYMAYSAERESAAATSRGGAVEGGLAGPYLHQTDGGDPLLETSRMSVPPKSAGRHSEAILAWCRGSTSDARSSIGICQESHGRLQ